METSICSMSILWRILLLLPADLSLACEFPVQTVISYFSWVDHYYKRLQTIISHCIYKPLSTNMYIYIYDVAHYKPLLYISCINQYIDIIYYSLI